MIGSILEKYVLTSEISRNSEIKTKKLCVCVWGGGGRAIAKLRLTGADPGIFKRKKGGGGSSVQFNNFQPRILR